MISGISIDFDELAIGVQVDGFEFVLRRRIQGLSILSMEDNSERIII